MKNTFKLGLSLFACAAALANAQGEGEIARYFDCWMENVGRIKEEKPKAERPQGDGVVRIQLKRLGGGKMAG